MTTSVGRPGAARRGLERFGGLAAILYVILFIGGTNLVFNGTPDSDAPPAKVIAYYHDSGHRDKINYGWLAVIIGVFFLLWFVAALRQRLRLLDPDGFLTNLATVGGVVYAALTLAGIGLIAGIATMSDDTFHHQVYPPLIHAAQDAGYVMHASGGVGAAAMMIAASVAAMRAAAIPRWTGWLGVVSGTAAIFSIFFFPQALIAIWLIVAGVLVFRAGPRAVAP
jgi:hypothetical protein